MRSALKYKQSNLPKQQGELARIKVIDGPDRGAIYILNGAKVTIGRGEECDVVILDLKASRIHAEILKVKTGWVLQDKGSANGLTHNGKVTRATNLSANDTIGIGDTLFEFVPSDVAPEMLVAPARTIQQLRAEQTNQLQRRQSMKGGGFSGFLKGMGGAGAASPKNASKGKLILGGLAALAAAMLFFGEDQPASTQKKKDNTQAFTADLASMLPAGSANKDAETIFKDGLREYLTGNYNRARSQFETVLQISPGHSLAKLYLENCDKSVEAEVKSHLEYGKKAFSSGKLRDARAHFERTMRLLYKDQTNPAYIEAKEQYDKVLKEIRGEDTI